MYEAGKIFLDSFIVSHDRFIFYRPTKNVVINGIISDKPEWSTAHRYPGIHLDMDPSLYQDDNPNNIKKINDIRKATVYDNVSGFISEGHVYHKSEGLHLQGMINVVNNLENDGGFVCVPKFTMYFDEWYKQKVQNGDFPTDDVGKYGFGELSKIDMKHIYNMKRITAKT